MEQKQLAINEDDRWAHAESLESKRLADDRRAELEFMKTLFNDYLPVGENREHIDQYFSRLEDVIFTKDGNVQEAVKNERWPTTTIPSDTDGLEDRQPEYRYFSASLFKEHAGVPKHLGHGEDMDYSTDDDGLLHSTQDQYSFIDTAARVSKCDGTEEAGLLGFDGNDSD